MELSELQRAWNEAGKTDPFWAVLSAPEKKRNRWQVEEFFETGRREIDGLMSYLASHRIDPPRRRALDFGCGPGRLSQALCRYFDRVDGVDISPSMIELAQRFNRQGERCAYHVNSRDDLGLFAGGTFDLIYSSLTLQHVKPPLIKRYLAEFFRLIGSSGIVVFQLPSRPAGLMGRLKRMIPNPVFDGYRRIRYGRHPAIAMYGMTPDDVRQVCAVNGARILDVTPQPRDRKWESFRYIGTRNGASAG